MDISLEGAGPVLMTSHYKRPAASRVMLRVRLLREHSTECIAYLLCRLVQDTSVALVTFEHGAQAAGGKHW